MQSNAITFGLLAVLPTLRFSVLDDQPFEMSAPFYLFEFGLVFCFFFNFGFSG